MNCHIGEPYGDSDFSPEERRDQRKEALEEVGAQNLMEVMRRPAPDFIFENCIRDKSITVITAPAGTGKSTLMLDMALCLDMGLPGD